MTYLLLAEKPSAARNFATALGGMEGTFNGQAYKIEPLFGHMTSFVEPHQMVDPSEADAMKSWSPEFMPWDETSLSWQKEAQKGRDRNGKMTSKQPQINKIKEVARSSGISKIIIATDKDPSGEGQLIGWEVIQAIGWSGPVGRMYFLDESEKEVKKAFTNIVDLPSANQDGEFVKADVRSKWDFLSMQLTRLSTDVARKNGYAVVVRQGRLKSVMTKLVADQLAEIKAYVKKPYFEVKYKDDAGNTYSRKPEGATADERDENALQFRHSDKSVATQEVSKYTAPAGITIDSTTPKKTAPGKLLDLGGLASILGTKGYQSKEVLQTYQKMYEARIVSYPRTEDKFISTEQFNEMLPLIDKIASVVGVDTSLLTHRQPRPTHVKEGGAHGANRPGTKVPTSLSSLSNYGPSAEAIYEILAMNFLAMFGEDYEYDSIKAHITEHPEFMTTVSVPKKQGFKAIFDTDGASKDESDDDTDGASQGVGSTANPLVTEGVNKKPPHPTHKWLERQLSKFEVGTGATRTNTLSEVTSGKAALLTNKKGKLGLTQIGQIASVLLDGSRIGDPHVTEQLFKAMKDAGDFKQKPADILATATELVRHDKEVFYRNAKRLHEEVGAPTKANQGFVQKQKTSGVFQPTGQTVSFSVQWSSHTFTPEEVEQLLRGETLDITVKTKKGNDMDVRGRLGEGVFTNDKGKSYKFWGFQPLKADEYTIDDAPFPKVWSGYTFTPEDEKRLRAGEKVKVKAVSKRTGKPFEVDVTFELVEPFKGKGDKRWGIKPHFEERKPATDYTRENAPFKTTFSGYTLTDEEVKAVRAGHQITVQAISKKGKEYTCNLSLELNEYKGSKFWGLKPHFN